jgi:thiamine-phosphate pyrophosphorylase
MRLYCITDRHQMGGIPGMLATAARALANGVHYLQLREKDLPACDQYELALALRRLPNPHRAKILINERTDIALAAGLDGVHLPGAALNPARIRAIAPPDFLVAISAHTAAELAATSADFAVFSPIFSKQAVGLDALREACRASRCPVYALGGVTWENAPLCLAAGAAGIAGIRLLASEMQGYDPEAQ